MDRTITIIIAAFIFGWIIDVAAGTEKQYTGTVIDMAFVAGNTSHSIGTAYVPQSNGNGGVATYSSTTTTPDKWTIIVKRSDGKVVSVDASADIFYSKKPGTTIKFYTHYGCITNINYGSKATD